MLSRKLSLLTLKSLFYLARRSTFRFTFDYYEILHSNAHARTQVLGCGRKGSYGQYVRNELVEHNCGQRECGSKDPARCGSSLHLLGAVQKLVELLDSESSHRIVMYVRHRYDRNLYCHGKQWRKRYQVIVLAQEYARFVCDDHCDRIYNDVGTWFHGYVFT